MKSPASHGTVAKAEICPPDGTLGWEGFRGWTGKHQQIQLEDLPFVISHVISRSPQQRYPMEDLLAT